jgi:hypothetical protein
MDCRHQFLQATSQQTLSNRLIGDIQGQAARPVAHLQREDDSILRSDDLKASGITEAPKYPHHFRVS